MQTLYSCLHLGKFQHLAIRFVLLSERRCGSKFSPSLFKSSDRSLEPLKPSFHPGLAIQSCVHNLSVISDYLPRFDKWVYFFLLLLFMTSLALSSNLMPSIIRWSCFSPLVKYNAVCLWVVWDSSGVWPTRCTCFLRGLSWACFGGVANFALFFFACRLVRRLRSILRSSLNILALSRSADRYVFSSQVLRSSTFRRGDRHTLSWFYLIFCCCC